MIKLRWDTWEAFDNNIKERPYEWMINHGYEILDWKPFLIADCVIIIVKEVFYPLPPFLKELDQEYDDNI